MVIKTGTNGEILMIVYVGQSPGDNEGQEAQHVAVYGVSNGRIRLSN